MGSCWGLCSEGIYSQCRHLVYGCPGASFRILRFDDEAFLRMIFKVNHDAFLPALKFSELLWNSQNELPVWKLLEFHHSNSIILCAMHMHNVAAIFLYIFSISKGYILITIS